MQRGAGRIGWVLSGGVGWGRVVVAVDAIQCSQSMIEEVLDEVEYFEMQDHDLPCSGSSLLKSAITNIAYTLKNNCIFSMPFSSRVPLEFSTQMQRVYMLGKLYDLNSQDQFYNSFEQVIWFSYRRLSKCEDVGWGCMIRVIQMMIAQAIARDQPQLSLDAVIDFFREERSGPLALSIICKMGNLGARWTNCPEILSVVSSILSELKHQGRIRFSFEIFCDQLEIGAPQQYAEGDFPKLISIHTKVGSEKTICEKYLFHLLQLMKNRHFVGIASGHKTEALYVLGTFKDLAIILDPHYVQEEESFDTYFCRNPQGINFTELASGISISFYIPTLEDFGEWVGDLLYAQRISANYNCFKIQVKDHQSWSTNRRKGSDDFQVLMQQ